MAVEGETKLRGDRLYIYRRGLSGKPRWHRVDPAAPDATTASLIEEPIPDSTPLGVEDLEGLRQSWIATRTDLNDAERANILKAQEWAYRKNWTSSTATTSGLLRNLHRRMFGDVWQWAGAYRTRQTNIGVPPELIIEQVEVLLGNIEWRAGQDPSIELLADYHHRLVSIHPFVNGNGRLARLAVDVLALATKQPLPAWGPNVNLSDSTTTRRKYIDALRIADQTGSLSALTSFMFPGDTRIDPSPS